MHPSAKSNRPSRKPTKTTSPAVETWVQMVRVYQRIMRRLDHALDGPGLSMSQFGGLGHLHFDGAITQNELAQRLLVTKGNVCGLIDRMETAGLVERTVCPEDRRANRLRLTDRGRALLTETLPTHLALVKEMMAPLRPLEVKTLQSLLEQLDPAEDGKEPVRGCG